MWALVSTVICTVKGGYFVDQLSDQQLELKYFYSIDYGYNCVKSQGTRKCLSSDLR